MWDEELSPDSFSTPRAANTQQTGDLNLSPHIETPAWDNSVDLNATIRTPEHEASETLNDGNENNLDNSTERQRSIARRLSFPGENRGMNGQADVQAAADCKLPNFWPEKPQLWFHQLEAEFATHRVTLDALKFSSVIRALDRIALEEVSDLLANPPENSKYEIIKTRIIERFDQSQEKKLDLMLNQLELGTKKPSQLYRYMQGLAGTNASEDLLKVKWINLLPVQARNILKVFKSSTTTLQELLDAADQMMDAPIPSSVYSVNTTPAGVMAAQSRSPDTTDLKVMMTQLIGISREILEKIQTQPQQRAPERGRDSRRSRSNSRSRPHTQGVCYYHNKFGSAATRCNLPCTFRASGNQ